LTNLRRTLKGRKRRYGEETKERGKEGRREEEVAVMLLDFLKTSFIF
jgi:hypothetical protein